ncbi:protein of unknown function [Bradyrhizobium sp. ORS 285]|nr:hypothetical protein BRAO285_180006 [Bradyrhizobium sp. ORS 285]SMX61033.1 protein of unknown function [Bradyrhizobium sp. ORS 285]
MALSTRRKAPFDPARAICERAAAAGVLRHPIGVLLVRGVGAGRSGLGPANIHEEPRGEVFAKFMSNLLNHPEVKPLLSSEHFSVDGTLIGARALHKSSGPRMARTTETMARTSTAKSARTTTMPA